MHFFVVFYKKGNLCDFLFAFLLKRGLLQEEEFALSGSKLFLLGVGPYSEGRQNPFINVSSCPESVSILLK